MENKNKELWADTAEISLLTLGLILSAKYVLKTIKRYKEMLAFSSKQLDLSIETLNEAIKKNKNES